MLRYVRVSGAFFALLAAVQLTRALLGWPVQVAQVTIPVWVSGLACLIVGSFAVWAWRVAHGAA
jgi:hypothetical protein